MREVTTRFVERAAEQDWCAVVDDEGQWFARHLVAEATELAKVLRSRGRLRPTVLVQSENSRRLAVAGLAIGLVDGTLALASNHFSSEDIAVTIEAVAQLSGVAKTTIYRRHDNRTSLLRAIVYSSSTATQLPVGLTAYASVQSGDSSAGGLDLLCRQAGSADGALAGDGVVEAALFEFHEPDGSAPGG